MCIPRYLAHRVDSRPDGVSRIRIAMTRVPGEPLDEWLTRPQPVGQDGPAAVRRGCALATLLIKQLAPTLEKANRFALHRDVNSRNVLMSDGVNGGVMDPEIGSVENARFWLIDFGLAVETATWPTQWQTSAISGDCRYWPLSSWMMSFYGAPSLKKHKDLVRQYETQLDSYALGVMALELLCIPALASCDPGKTAEEDELRGSWRRLLNAWTKYRKDVTRWHSDIHKVFAAGVDTGPLFKRMAQERTVERLSAHVSTLRSCLRACIDRTNEPTVKNLIWVIAELIDETSSITLQEAVAGVSGDALSSQRRSVTQHASTEKIEPASMIQWSPPEANASNLSPLKGAPRRSQAPVLTIGNLSPLLSQVAVAPPFAGKTQTSPRPVGSTLGEKSLASSRNDSQQQLIQSPVRSRCGGA